ncbi:MAG: TRAP transporter small permease subunit [Eubacteriales bacterium]|nr:TRAP transporter small permease subunit [Eubacteriales bacterium]
MNKLEQTAFWKALRKLLRFGLILSAILVTLITFAAVITRELNVNFLGYEEILIICAFWLYMLGTAYGSYEDSHIKADVIVVMMPEGRMKSTLAMIRNALSLILGILFLAWAFQLFQWTIIMENKTPVWRIPMTVSQSSLLFGLTVASFYHAVYLYDEIKLYIGRYVTKKIPIEPSSDDIKEV